MNIEIRPFQMEYYGTLIDMAMENYNLEKMQNKELRETIERSYFNKKLHDLFANGVGNIALENNEIIGYLYFTHKSGNKEAVSPLYGYGVRHIKRGEIISKLFQATAAELCENFASDLQVNVYAHDSDVLWTYIMSAFAMDVTDVVRNTLTPIDSKNVNYTFNEISKADLLSYRSDVIEMYRNLINHLRVSPVFYHCKYFMPIEDKFMDFISDNIRVFAVFNDGKLIGMVISEPPDKGFAIEDSDAMSLSDLFVKSDYRRQNIGAALLAFANDELRKSGIKRIFVTHGTINTTARGFWDRYFTNYSFTMIRQIDPNMLGIIQPI